MRPEYILTETAHDHGVTIVQIIGRSQRRPVVNARHDTIHRLRQRTDMSLTEIGRFLGNRDHTTIMQALKFPQPVIPNPRQLVVRPAVCTVEGCSGRQSKRDWCWAHYKRWLRHGDVFAGVPVGSSWKLVLLPCGTKAAYRRGCRCDGCRAANTLSNRAYYPPRQRISALPALRRLDELVESGMPLADIADRAGLPYTTVVRLRNDPPETMYRRTAEPLMAVTKPCETCGGKSIADGRWCGVGRCVYRSGRWSWSTEKAA